MIIKVLHSWGFGVLGDFSLDVMYFCKDLVEIINQMLLMILLFLLIIVKLVHRLANILNQGKSLVELKKL